jgi:thiol peroxidase
MAQITFKGNPIHTCGDLPAVGSTAPDFSLVAADLSEKSLDDFAGKKKVLTINPSLDTGVCQAAARRFNESLGKRSDVVVLVVTRDLPFAQKRFCESEGLAQVVSLSSFRSAFGSDYGAEMIDGPLRGLLARAVLVLDASNRVLSSQLVPEITQEPDYDAAAKALG